MRSTSEMKQEGLTADALKRPSWMDDLTPDTMTEEQRKVTFSFQTIVNLVTLFPVKALDGSMTS